jgi:hypothetical protein
VLVQLDCSVCTSHSSGSLYIGLRAMGRTSAKTVHYSTALHYMTAPQPIGFTRFGAPKEMSWA